ncbi:MAG TPA: sigma-E factor negative regulatory protein [Ideonella sp.]|nr:sigma-E factor negative regulatory protein [Ideonella sp.]
MMTEPSNDQERALQQLSALADGECEPGQLLAACDVWRRDGRVRASWHAYALIGDVMRSDDLASPVAHDAQFLQGLRARLAAEPVILAPAAAPSQPVEVPVQGMPRLAVGGGGAGLGFVGRGSVHRRRWVAPAAVAAGFVVVTGAMVAMRSSVPDSGALALVQNSPLRNPPRTEQLLFDPEVAIVRNPELDRYLNAHRQYTQGPALAGPGGVRQVADTPGGR